MGHSFYNFYMKNRSEMILDAFVEGCVAVFQCGRSRREKEGGKPIGVEGEWKINEGARLVFKTNFFEHANYGFSVQEFSNLFIRVFLSC